MLGGVFQGPEILIILLLVVLLIWGPTKLPQLARGLGQALYEFKKASQGSAEREDKQARKTGETLSSVDDETLRRIAEKLGISTENKSRSQLVEEIVKEAKRRGLLDELDVRKT
ncbi:twin-arginine translocase TatA/TatE family subunit [Hyperthermus butylicus]|uniref:Sec-independent secretion pathway protein n=1 Tax=Hyperthermus butylicus (strain DSM 5456 / JCM 9403 / PLM1-5) TaxID=415426 RepID=A2BJH5_HYPBU|nr:twin-arginine translocase TatA/TatE family subunit [Hyperthermus butylicus]ABM80136.1 Sec-independent secretion pathway protein [Hyperthermus butylicus DSM 5456]